jgi:hypothetical protein
MFQLASSLQAGGLASCEVTALCMKNVCSIFLLSYQEPIAFLRSAIVRNGGPVPDIPAFEVRFVSLKTLCSRRVERKVLML